MFDSTRVRIRAARALTTRLNNGYGHTNSSLAVDYYFVDPKLRQTIGADPLRPQNVRKDGLETLDRVRVEQSFQIPINLDSVEQEILECCLAYAVDSDVRAVCNCMGGKLTSTVIGEWLGLSEIQVLRKVSAGSSLATLGLVTLESLNVDGIVAAHPKLISWAIGATSFNSSFEIWDSKGQAPLSEVLLNQVNEAIGSVSDLSSVAVMILGRVGVGKRAAALSVANSLGKPMLIVDGKSSRLPELLTDALVDCVVGGYMPCIANLDEQEEEESVVTSRWIDQFPGLVVVTSSDKPRLTTSRPLHTISIAPAVLNERVVLWKNALDRSWCDFETDAAAVDLAARYTVGGSTITEVVRESRKFADSQNRKVSRDDIETSVGRRLTLRLGAYGNVVTRKASLNQMVLPEDVKDVIKDMIAMVEKRSTIFETWGFSSHLSLARGVASLFSGKPGTGKTMAASVIASHLGLDLVRVDLSSVVSKWVGETEKHLAKIFDEAQSANAMLLFDEADSLFGKRTDVSSAQDRYANLEVNYILQRMESFDGISILTTNFEASIDQAFLRRLSFRVRFPEPEEEERLLLWKTLLPTEAGVDVTKVDFAKLAKVFEMTGGHIKNAIVRAAVIAARQNRRISGDDLLRGAGQEYEEMGKVMPTMV